MKQYTFTLRTVLVSLTCFVILLSVFGNQRFRHRALKTRFSNFYRLIRQQEYGDAFQLMSQEYRTSHSVKEFASDASIWLDDLPMRYAHIPLFRRTASVFQSDPPVLDIYSGPIHYWEFDDGNWYFTGSTELSLD
jgi:hypothetical protein